MTSLPSLSTDADSRPPSRRDLLGLMDHSRDFSLTLIQASAGSGKTTLLRQWLEAPGGDVVLLSLGRRDNDAARFFRRLVEALREVVPGFHSLSYNDLSTDIELPAEAVAEPLLEALALVPGELCVLIDDFHHAASPLIQGVFAILLDRLPPQVHFIIATRAHPGFSLSRLKLEDRLLLIDGHDLRLSAADVQGLGNELGLASLPAEEVERLLLLTRGWAAAVKMALLARSGGGRLRLEAFDGSQPEMVDYFAHVVLSGLPGRLRGFLLETSVFDSFSVALCEELLDLPDARLLLEQLLAQNLFIHAIEENPGQYRYHPLFQNFLQSRLRGEAPARLVALHGAASRYFLAHGDEESALAHARLTRDESQLLAVLRQCCDAWMHKGCFLALIRALEPLPDSTIAQDPGLVLPLLAALILSRRFNQARYYIDLVGPGGLAAASEAERAQFGFLEQMLLLFQHDSDFWSGFDEQRAMTPGSSDIRAFSMAMLARYRLQKGDCRAAREHARQAKVALARLGYDYLASLADVIAIQADRHRGHMFEARQLGGELFERYRDAVHTPCGIGAGTAMAVIYYEQNRLDDAQRLLEDLITVIDSACATESVLNVYLTLSRLLALQGQHVRAARLLAQLRRILDLGNYDFFMSQLAAEEMRQAIARGQPEPIERVAADHGLLRRYQEGCWLHTRPYDEAWVYYGLAAAHYLLHRGRLEEAGTLLGTLSECMHGSQMKARTTVIDAALVVLQYRRGDVNGSFRALRELVADAGLLCITRTTFDETPGLARVMRQACEACLLELPGIYRQTYHDLVGEAAVSAAAGVPGQRLTGKEREILGLLRRGLSNKEISRRTNTSLSTTKWHLKNIFAKLGVTSRACAILSAPPEALPESAHG